MSLVESIKKTRYPELVSKTTAGVCKKDESTVQEESLQCGNHKKNRRCAGRKDGKSHSISRNKGTTTIKTRDELKLTN